MDVDNLFIGFFAFLIFAVFATEVFGSHRSRQKETTAPATPRKINPFASGRTLQTFLVTVLERQKDKLGIFSSIRVAQDEHSSVQLFPVRDPNVDQDFYSKTFCIVVDCNSLATDPYRLFITAVYLFENDGRILPPDVLERYPFVDPDQVIRPGPRMTFRSAECFKMSDVFHEQDQTIKLGMLVSIIVGFAQNCSDIAANWKQLKSSTAELRARDEIDDLVDSMIEKSFNKFKG